MWSHEWYIYTYIFFSIRWFLGGKLIFFLLKLILEKYGHNFNYVISYCFKYFEKWCYLIDLMYYKTYVVYEIDNIPEKNDIRTNFVSGWKFMNLDKIFNGEFVHWSKFFFFFLQNFILSKLMNLLKFLCWSLLRWVGKNQCKW